MTATELSYVGPWPGPIPYGERHRHVFKGRSNEIVEVYSKLRANRLVLMTAWSGVGKTSFLRAGMTPELRSRRAKAVALGESDAQPAVLLLRDWIDGRSTSVDAFFTGVLRQGVEDLASIAEQYEDAPDISRSLQLDHEALMTVEPTPTDAFGYLDALAKAGGGGLVLLLDQFEEALQIGYEHSLGLMNLIAKIYKHLLNVRVLMSFREEFLSNVMRLGNQIDSLNNLGYSLPQITAGTLRDALQGSASVANVRISDPAMDELMNWLQQAEGSRPSQSNPTAGVRPGAVSSKSSIDLLKLQAVLVDLYETAASLQGDRENVAISADTLQAVRTEAEVAAGRVVTGAEVVEYALERFIDRRVLPMPPSVTISDGLPTGIGPEDWRTLEHRRAAARMAEFFSTGMLKIPQFEPALLARAWREEWLVLSTTAEHVEDALSDMSVLESDFGHVLELADEPVARGAGILSGPAREQLWSANRAAGHLLRISREALQRLVDTNVIRPKVSLEGRMYELVHDGFGPALVAWAEEKRQTPVDMLAATIAQRGQECNWKRLEGVIEDVCWRGCLVGPDMPGGELVIEGVYFRSSDLRGSFFERCVFRGGAFIDCDLDFVVFQDCTFDGTDSEPFRFSGVRGNGLNFSRGAAKNVRFEQSTLSKMWWNPPSPTTGHSSQDFELGNVQVHDCTLSGWTVDSVKFTAQGILRVSESWLGLSDLFGLTANVDQVRFDDCQFVYCPVNKELSDVIRRGEGNTRYPQDTAPENWKDLNPADWDDL